MSPSFVMRSYDSRFSGATGMGSLPERNCIICRGSDSTPRAVVKTVRIYFLPRSTVLRSVKPLIRRSSFSPFRFSGSPTE